MQKTRKIIHWEIMRNLRDKQYIISLFITPVIIGLFAVFPRILERFDKPEIVRYYVIDEMQVLNKIQNAIPGENLILEQYEGERHEIESAAGEENYTGYFTLSEDFWQTGILQIHFTERSQTGERIIRSVLSSMLQHHRMSELAIDQDLLRHLISPAELEMIPMEEAVVLQRNEIIVSVAFTVLIFSLIFTTGMMLIYSTSQEKRDRTAEIILSSVKPFQLMQGKIIGHFLLGIIQLLFWIALSLPAIIWLLEFPVFQALAETNMVLIIVFGLLGYLLFSSLYVSIGATMEDLQSAGNSQGFVFLLPMFSFLFIAPLTTNPNGTVSRFASIFPLTSPVLMILRNALTQVPLWEILLSGFLLAASGYLAMRIAGKVFKTGMLMYGKTATIGEIIRWLKHRD